MVGCKTEVKFPPAGVIFVGASDFKETTLYDSCSAGTMRCERRLVPRSDEVGSRCPLWICGRA